tara:strand:+ start:476 stop:760 length:285 start_codon:yes stop_codon:yes gene_type:complete
MTEETNPISDMIDHIHNSEFEKASAIWNDAIGQRVGDALDQEKIAVAQSIYTIDNEDLDDEDLGDETMEVDEDDVDLEVSDEELEAAAADLEEV